MRRESKIRKNKFYSPPKLRFVKTGLIMISFLAFIAACSKGTGTSAGTGSIPGGSSIDCSGPVKTFSADVKPTIQGSCATNSSCHGTGSNNGPGELISYSQVFNARTIIRSAVLSGLMPLSGSLTAAQKNAIICWIDNGAPNN